MRRSPKRCTRRIPKRDAFPHFHPRVSSLSKNPPFFLHPGLAVPHRSLQGAARSDHAPGKPALDPALESAGFQVLPGNSGETSNSPIRIRIIVIFQKAFGIAHVQTLIENTYHPPFNIDPCHESGGSIIVISMTCRASFLVYKYVVSPFNQIFGP